MFAMGSVGQEKLACAIKVTMKHLERSYSTLCGSVLVSLKISGAVCQNTCTCFVNFVIQE